MFEEQTYKVEPTCSTTDNNNNTNNDNNMSSSSFVQNPQRSNPTSTTSEEKAPIKPTSTYRSMIPDSLLPTHVAASSLASGSSCSMPKVGNAQDAQKTMAEEERWKWIAAFDAKQPGGCSISAAQRKELVREFRVRQANNAEPVVVLEGTGKEKKSFWKRIF